MEETTRIYKQRLIMDCKDLMIGDLVYVHEPECKGHRIDAIDELDGQVGADGEVYDECDIRPIPLTEDILVKNGFTKTTNDWNRHRPLIIFESMEFPTISIHADMDMKHFWVHGTIDLTYVHQLQHLLRLCGIDKEIEP